MVKHNNSNISIVSLLTSVLLIIVATGVRAQSSSPSASADPMQPHPLRIVFAFNALYSPNQVCTSVSPSTTVQDPVSGESYPCDDAEDVLTTTKYNILTQEILPYIENQIRNTALRIRWQAPTIDFFTPVPEGGSTTTTTPTPTTTSPSSPQSQNIFVPYGTVCDYFSIPNSHRPNNAGIPDADVVLYISALPGNKSLLSWPAATASACMHEGDHFSKPVPNQLLQSAFGAGGRPVVSIVNVPPAAIHARWSTSTPAANDISMKRIMKGVLQALGLSWEYASLPNLPPSRIGTKVTSLVAVDTTALGTTTTAMPTTSTSIINAPQERFTVPTSIPSDIVQTVPLRFYGSLTLQMARDYFQCASIAFVPFVNVSNHNIIGFDARWLKDEVASISYRSRDSVSLSKFAMAALVDINNASYSLLPYTSVFETQQGEESIIFGANGTCNFVVHSCQTTTGGAGQWFCPVSDQTLSYSASSDSKLCNYDYSGRGRCTGDVVSSCLVVNVSVFSFFDSLPSTMPATTTSTSAAAPPPGPPAPSSTSTSTTTTTTTTTSTTTTTTTTIVGGTTMPPASDGIDDACTVPSLARIPTGSDAMRGDIFNPESRCFVASTIVTGRSDPQPRATRCFASRCDPTTGKVQFKVGSTSAETNVAWITCNTDGQVIVGPSGFSGSVTCPPRSQFCAAYNSWPARAFVDGIGGAIQTTSTTTTAAPTVSTTTVSTTAGQSSTTPSPPTASTTTTAATTAAPPSIPPDPTMLEFYLYAIPTSYYYSANSSSSSGNSGNSSASSSCTPAQANSIMRSVIQTSPNATANIAAISQAFEWDLSRLLLIEENQLEVTSIKLLTSTTTDLTYPAGILVKVSLKNIPDVISVISPYTSSASTSLAVATWCSSLADMLNATFFATSDVALCPIAGLRQGAANDVTPPKDSASRACFIGGSCGTTILLIVVIVVVVLLVGLIVWWKCIRAPGPAASSTTDEHGGGETDGGDEASGSELEEFLGGRRGSGGAGTTQQKQYQIRNSNTRQHDGDLTTSESGTESAKKDALGRRNNNNVAMNDDGKQGRFLDDNYQPKRLSHNSNNNENGNDGSDAKRLNNLNNNNNGNDDDDDDGASLVAHAAHHREEQPDHDPYLHHHHSKRGHRNHNNNENPDAAVNPIGKVSYLSYLKKSDGGPATHNGRKQSSNPLGGGGGGGRTRRSRPSSRAGSVRDAKSDAGSEYMFGKDRSETTSLAGGAGFGTGHQQQQYTPRAGAGTGAGGGGSGSGYVHNDHDFGVRPPSAAPATSSMSTSSFSQGNNNNNNNRGGGRNSPSIQDYYVTHNVDLSEATLDDL